MHTEIVLLQYKTTTFSYGLKYHFSDLNTIHTYNKDDTKP